MAATQTTYSRNHTAAGYSGQVATTEDFKAEAFLNAEGSDIPAGIGVQQTSGTEGSAEEFDSPANPIVGVSILSYARDPDSLTGDDAIKAAAEFDVLTEGEIWVQVEQTVTVSDAVYCRHTSDGGSNTQLGRFRKDSDSGKARLVKGARWVRGGTSGSRARLAFSRAAEAMPGDQVSFVVDHAAVTGDTTTKVLKTHANRHFQVERVDYVNPTGLAGDASNYFNIKLQYGSTTVIANWSTLSSAEGTLTADTWVAMTLNATPANLVLAPGTEVSLFLDETGTSSLPAGKLVIHGRFL